jgi:DNA-binding SARP family transcriptional activator/tetratricopeptide (TPR) repeat protein
MASLEPGVGMSPIPGGREVMGDLVPGAEGHGVFELTVLGRPALLRKGEPQPPGTQKALALACYLGAVGEPVSREQLAALFWPDSDPSRARRSLRGELARLRSALSAAAFDGSRLQIWLDPSVVGVDVRLFRVLAAQGHDTEAVRLYRGPLCDGLNVRDAEPFEEWLRAERDALEITYLQSLRRLIVAERARGNASAALDWSRRAIRSQPLNEDFYALAMEAAEDLDDRAAVLGIYRELKTVLRNELGISPGAEASAAARRAAQQQPERARPVQAASGDHAFIGHARESAILWECQRRAGNGAGSLVFIHGPAGVGKTRLVREFAAGQRAVWCRAQRPVSKVAYYPIAAGLREYLSLWGVPAVNEVWLKEAARVCPELSRAAQNTSLGAPEDKVRLVDGLAATLTGAAGRGGVLIFDDIQWADADTVAVLGDLVQGLPRLPLMIVVIARSALDHVSGEVSDIIAAAARYERLTDMTIGDLSETELTALIQGFLAGAGSPDTSEWLEEFAHLVYEVLGGNPFYAIECTRLTLDGMGGLTMDALSAARFGVPDVVRARLAGLPRHLRHLTDAAATSGEPIDPDVLTRMLDIGPWELADHLDDLVARRILVSRRGVVRFAHDLLAEVIYESLPSAKRQLLHERAARALSSAYALNLDGVSGQIAAHFEAAAKDQEAIPHHERAAEAARRAHAHQMAIHHYQRLRTLLPQEQQVPLLLRLGELLSYGTTAGAEEIYREALQMAMLQGDGRAQAQCFFALGVLSRRRADLSRSKHALSEALRRFEVYGDLEGVEKSLEAMTYAYIQQGDLAAAKSSARKAAEIARETGRLPNLGRATLSLGVAHLYGGEYTRALESFEHARDVAQSTGDDLAQAEALRYLSAVYGADGRLGTPGQAWMAGERAIEICASVGHRTGLARAADGLGGAYLRQQDWPRAIDCYVTALHLTNTFGYAWGFDAMVYRVGYALLLAGNNEHAEHVLHQAVTLSRNLNAPYWLCRALMALSELSYQSGRTLQADSYATDALDLAKGLRHREYLSSAKSLLARGAPKTASAAKRQVPRDVRSPGAGNLHKNHHLADLAARLPDVPPALEIPVQGTDAVVVWLDQIVAHLLSGS